MKLKYTNQTPSETADYLRHELALLKSGARHIYANVQDKPMHDVTSEHTALLERALELSFRSQSSGMIGGLITLIRPNRNKRNVSSTAWELTEWP